MGNLIPKVGGAEHVHCLLAPLENLSTVEETVVREKAVEAAVKVGKAMNEEGIHEHYIPLVQVRCRAAPRRQAQTLATLPPAPAPTDPSPDPPRRKVRNPRGAAGRTALPGAVTHRDGFRAKKLCGP